MKLFTMLLTKQRYADIHVLLMMKHIIIDRRSKTIKNTNNNPPNNMQFSRKATNNDQQQPSSNRKIKPDTIIINKSDFQELLSEMIGRYNVSMQQRGGDNVKKSKPLPMAYRTSFPWYIEPLIHGILKPLPIVYIIP